MGEVVGWLCGCLDVWVEWMLGWVVVWLSEVVGWMVRWVVGWVNRGQVEKKGGHQRRGCQAGSAETMKHMDMETSPRPKALLRLMASKHRFLQPSTT